MDYSRSDLLATVIPLYQQFFQENKIRILVYSGDVDGVVPHTGIIIHKNYCKMNEQWVCVTTGTEEWLGSESLGLTVVKPFQAWKGKIYVLMMDMCAEITVFFFVMYI